MPLSIPAFVTKWQASTRTERSAAQENWLDLCEALGQPKPGDVYPRGDFYTFERGASKVGGGGGFADVWWAGKFGIEYKRGRSNLAAAYNQLLQYREDLGNPPLLAVTDGDRWEVHTNFTGTQKVVYRFSLADIGRDAGRSGLFLRELTDSSLVAYNRAHPDHRDGQPRRRPDDVATGAGWARTGPLRLRLTEEFGRRPHRAGAGRDRRLGSRPVPARELCTALGGGG